MEHGANRCREFFVYVSAALISYMSTFFNIFILLAHCAFAKSRTKCTFIGGGGANAAS